MRPRLRGSREDAAWSCPKGGIRWCGGALQQEFGRKSLEPRSCASLLPKPCICIHIALAFPPSVRRKAIGQFISWLCSDAGKLDDWPCCGGASGGGWYWYNLYLTVIERTFVRVLFSLVISTAFGVTSGEYADHEYTKSLRLAYAGKTFFLHRAT